MKRKTEIIKCDTIESIPTVETVSQLPRSKELKIVFGDKIQAYREKIGNHFKESLKGFQVGIHMLEPEINICKLITDTEIDQHQDFFEECAKDYRALSESLIFELEKHLNVKINSAFPLLTFNQLKMSKQGTGKMGLWRYFLHGFHCRFEHLKTKQLIEVSLVFGLEFGDLYPYFFSGFIKSTKDYSPLPVDINEDYADGQRIIDRMLQLGKFEKINTNMSDHFAVVVTDRPKVKIEICKDDSLPADNPKFNLKTWLGL